MLKYEFKKTIFKKSTIIVFFIALLVMIGFLLYSEQLFIKTRSESYKNSAYKASVRKEFITKMSNENGIISEFYSTDREVEATECDTNIVTALVKNSVFVYASCFVITFLMATSISVEYEKKLHGVICIKMGNVSTGIFNKILVMGIFSFVAMLIYFIFYLFIQYILMKYSANELFAPLYLVKGFEYSKSGITVIGMLAIQFLYGYMAAIALGMLAMLISSIIKKSVISIAVAEIILALFIALEKIYDVLFISDFVSRDKFIFSAAEFGRFYRGFKLLNPFALLDINYYYEKPGFKTIGNYILNNISQVCMITVVAVIAICLIICGCNRLPARRDIR